MSTHSSQATKAPGSFPVCIAITCGLAVLFSAGGCGRKGNESAIQDQVDFSDASDLFSAPLPSQRRHPPPETVMVTVDDRAITFAELQREINILLVHTRKSGLPPEQLDQYRSRLSDQALQNLVIKKLLADAIEREEVAVAEEDLNKQIEALRASLPEGATFEDILKNNQLTEEGFRNELALSIQVEKLLQDKVSGLIEPSDEEVAAYYAENQELFVQPESVTIRHLFISAPEDTDDAARQAVKERAEALRVQLEEGANFGELAAAHSDDVPNRDQGGLLEDVTRGRLPAPLEETVFSLATGELAPVVETRLGYHLVRLEQKNPSRALELDEIRDQIRLVLTRQKQKTALEKYVNDLKERATISFPQQPGS